MTSRFENNGSLNPSLHMQVPGEALSDAQRLEGIFTDASPVEIAQRLQQFYASKKDTLTASGSKEFVDHVVACLKKMPVDAQPQLRILAELDKIDSDLFGLLLKRRGSSDKQVLGKEVYEPIVKDPSIAIEIAGYQPKTLLKLLDETINSSTQGYHLPSIFVDQQGEYYGGQGRLPRATLIPLFEKLAEFDFQAVLKILSFGSRSSGSTCCGIDFANENLFEALIPMFMKHSQSTHGRAVLREFFSALGCNGNAQLLEGEITPVKLLAIFLQNTFYHTWHGQFIKYNVRFTSEEILQAHKWAAEHLGEKGDLTIDPKEATKMLENSQEVLPFEHPLRRQCLTAITEDYALTHNQVFSKELQLAIASSAYSLEELEGILSLIIEKHPYLPSFAFVAEQLEFLRQNRAEDPSKLQAFIKRIAEQIESKCSDRLSREIVTHESHDKSIATLAKYLPAIAIKLFFTHFEDFTHRGYTTVLKRIDADNSKDAAFEKRMDNLYSVLQSACETLFSGADQAYEVSAGTRGWLAKEILQSGVITSESPLYVYEAALDAVSIQDLPGLMAAKQSPGPVLGIRSAIKQSERHGPQISSTANPQAIRSRLLKEIAFPDNSLEDLQKCLIAYIRMDISCEHLFPLFISLSQHRSQEQAAVDELLQRVCSSMYASGRGSRALVDQMRAYDENSFFEFANNHPIVTAYLLKTVNAALDKIENDQAAELTEKDRTYFAQKAAKLLDIARRSFYDQYAPLYQEAPGETPASLEDKEDLAFGALKSALFESTDPFFALLMAQLPLYKFMGFLETQKVVNPAITHLLTELVAASAASTQDLTTCLTRYFNLRGSFASIVQVFEALHRREDLSAADLQKLKEEVFSLIIKPQSQKAFQIKFPMGSSDSFESDLYALEKMAKDYPYKVTELLILKFYTPEEYQAAPKHERGVDNIPHTQGLSLMDRPETCESARAIHEAVAAGFIAKLENSTDPDETRKLIEHCFNHAIFSQAFIRDIVTNKRDCSFAPQLIKYGTENIFCHRFFDKETIESLLLSPSGLDIAKAMTKAWDPKTRPARLLPSCIKPAFMTDTVELMRLLSLRLAPDLVSSLIIYGCDNKLLNSKHITELLLSLQNPALVQVLMTNGIDKMLFKQDDIMSIWSQLHDPEITNRLIDYAVNNNLFDREGICRFLSSSQNPQVIQKLVQVAARKKFYVADVARAVLLSKDNSEAAFTFVARVVWGGMLEKDEIQDLLSQPLDPDVANALKTYGLDIRLFNKDRLKEISESSQDSYFKSAIFNLCMSDGYYSNDDIKEMLLILQEPNAICILANHAVRMRLFGIDAVRELISGLQVSKAVNVFIVYAIQQSLFNAEDVRNLLANPLDPEVAHELAAYALRRQFFGEDDEMFDFVVSNGAESNANGPYALHKLHLDNRQIPTAVIPPVVEVEGIPVSFSLEGMQEAAKAFNVPISQIPKNATVENWRALCKELEFRLNGSLILRGTYRSFDLLWNATFSRDYFEQLLDLSSCRTFVPTHKAHFAAILNSLLSHPITLSAQQEALYWYLHAMSSTGGSEQRTTNADYYNGLPPKFKYSAPEPDSDGSDGVPLAQIPRNVSVQSWRALCEELERSLGNSETFQKTYGSFKDLWDGLDSVEDLLDFSSHEGVVPADKAQFAAIVSYFLSLPFLSAREESLYWYLDSTSACSSGKRTTNAAYYKGLPAEFKYRAQGLDSNESEEVVRAKQEALENIHDTVEYFLESDTRMYTELLRLMGRAVLSQNVHDIEYVKNSVGYLLGIPDLVFDQYASPLNIKRDQILEICLKHLTPKVLVEMLKKASLKEAKAVSEKDGAVFNPLMTTLIGSSEAFWDISVEEVLEKVAGNDPKKPKLIEIWYQKLNEQGALQILGALGVIQFHAAPVIGNWKKELSFAVNPVGNFTFDLQLTQGGSIGEIRKQMVEFRKRFNAELKQMALQERCSYLHTWLSKIEESRQKLRDAVPANALPTFDAQWTAVVQEAEKSYATSLQQFVASRLREADALSILTLMELQSPLFHMLFPESTVSVAEVPATIQQRRKLKATWENGISYARNERILTEINGPNLIRTLKITKGIAAHLSDEQRATFADILMGEEFLARRWTAFKEELAGYRHLFASQPTFDIKPFIEFCERAALLLPPEDAGRLPEGLVPFDGYADVARDIEELITAVENKAAVEHILDINDAKAVYDPLARRFGHAPMKIDMQVNQ